MNLIKEIIMQIRARGAKKTVTVFPKGTIVKYYGVPCELLEDCMFYSANFTPLSPQDQP